MNLLSSHGTKSTNNFKIHYWKFYIPIILKQLSAIFMLNHTIKFYSLWNDICNVILLKIFTSTYFSYQTQLPDFCLLHYSDIISHYSNGICFLQCHHSFYHIFKKRNSTSPLMNESKGNTSRFGSAIQVLPSWNKYF